MPLLSRRDQAHQFSSDGEAKRKSSAPWNEGLELARACAIILVVYSHGKTLLERDPTWAWLNQAAGLESFFKPGWWGVRIFFALSGYLIGRQVIDVLNKGQLKLAIYFALRRWIRTVPTYWLLLGGVCLWEGVSWLSPTAITNALFLQSALPTQSSTSLIEVAWSLVIEEWSYGFLALLVLLFSLTTFSPTSRQAAKTVILICLASTALSIAARLWASNNIWINWEILKKTSTLQLDSLAAGICMAGLEILRPNQFQRLTQSQSWAGGVSIAGMSLFGWYLNAHFGSQSNPSSLDWALLGAIGYPLSSILSCGFLALLWPVKISHWPNWIKLALRLLANTSYSLYLVHLSVALSVAAIWPDMNGLLAFLLYIIASVGLGSLSWLALEKPFLKLRRYLRPQ